MQDCCSYAAERLSVEQLNCHRREQAGRARRRQRPGRRRRCGEVAGPGRVPAHEHRAAVRPARAHARLPADTLGHALRANGLLGSRTAGDICVLGTFSVSASYADADKAIPCCLSGTLASKMWGAAERMRARRQVAV